MLSRISLSVAFLTAAFALPGHARAPWQPQGPQFQVNDRIAFEQYHPSVAINPEGRVFVAWVGAGPQGKVYNESGHPISGDIQIDDSPGGLSRVKVAVGRDGQFVVIWDSSFGIKLRLFDADGQPLSNVIKLSEDPAFLPDMATDAEGNFFVTWWSQGWVLLQKFDFSGSSLNGAVVVASEGVGSGFPHIAVDPSSGEALVVWVDEREAENSDVWGRRYASSGQPLGPEFRVTSRRADYDFEAVPIFHPDGGFSVVWNTVSLESIDILAQSFDARGVRIGQEAVLSQDAWVAFYLQTSPYPAVLTTPSGNLLVLWSGIETQDVNGGIVGRLFDRSWRPLGDRFQVNTFTRYEQTEPAVTVDSKGNFFVAWSDGELPDLHSGGAGNDGSSYGVFGQRFTLAEGCVPEATRLCLNQNRFQVEATWRKPSGETGVGHAVPLTGDTGALWFFGAENLELLIKVLDARAVNGHFWVYAGALSNVEYTIKVTDTSTGEERSYRNPPGQFASRADTEAFRDDAPVSASAAKAPAAAVPQTAPLSPAIPCSPSPQSLCFMQGQFEITVEFTDPRTGLKGQARSVPLTADTGAFWFFDSANLELMIKVLDARPVNGRFWVFFGALSDVDYTITVTDRVHGGQKVYRNRQGELASRADVEAF